MEALQLPRFGLEVRPDRARAVLAVSGELDIATAPALREALDELWQLGWSDVAIDASGISFIDSTGLGMLLSLSRAAVAAEGRRLTIARSCPALERLIAVSRLEEVLPRS